MAMGKYVVKEELDGHEKRMSYENGKFEYLLAADYYTDGSQQVESYLSFSWIEPEPPVVLEQRDASVAMHFAISPTVLRIIVDFSNNEFRVKINEDRLPPFKLEVMPKTWRALIWAHEMFAAVRDTLPDHPVLDMHLRLAHLRPPYGCQLTGGEVYTIGRRLELKYDEHDAPKPKI